MSLVNLPNAGTTIGSLQIVAQNGDAAIINSGQLQLTNNTINSLVTNGGITTNNNNQFKMANGTITNFNNLIDIDNGTINNNDINGLLCNVYDDPSGTGVSWSRILLTTTVQNINFTNFSPVTGKSTNFMCRFTGWIKPLYTENYTFTTTSDDGIRVFIGHSRIIDSYVVGGPATNSGTIQLTANQWFPISIDYFQAGGGSNLVLQWSSTSQVQQVVPSSAFSFSNIINNPATLGNTNFDGNINAFTNYVGMGNLFIRNPTAWNNISGTGTNAIVRNMASTLPLNNNAVLSISTAGQESFVYPSRTTISINNAAVTGIAQPFDHIGRVASTNGRGTIYCTVDGTANGAAIFTSKPVVSLTAELNASINNAYQNIIVAIDSISADFKQIVVNTTSLGSQTVVLAGNTAVGVSCTVHFIVKGLSNYFPV